MQTEEKQNYLIRIVAESDDFDGVASYGIAHRDFDGVVQVLVPEEDGWWEEAYVPYLLFYRGDTPDHATQELLVHEAIENDTYEYCSPDTSFLEVNCEKRPYEKVKLVDSNSFEEMARHGMIFGHFYRQASYWHEDDGQLFLLFCDSADDLPQFDLDDIELP
ncbi:hypothetical protein [Tumebacillus flagellatus]|uniref:Uncharacterized protein n=1 Tax=Tumebacillus flagellatus TaxID=1157490 RepID=A0A074LUF4_9BACL|nr:hypothetical protein [Tumebacillus flagellatus]KEO83563.1 hypothetical protein EL26_09115 [Tumebacillus flagellatus]